MARQTTRRSQTIALLVLLACLIGSGVAVWGLGAQDRISSDRYDIRTPALESAPDTLQGHALWTIEALNGREVSNEEITSRLSTEMLLSVSPSQVQRDFAEVRARGPFEYRGYEIDAEGVLAAGLRAPSGEVLQIAALQSADPARLRMLRLDVGESRRGPFTSVEAVVHLVAAWGLLLSGAATWVLRFRPRTGQLLLGAGMVWLLQFLELTNSAGLYTVGLVAGPLGAALVAVALLSFGGRFGQLEWVAGGVAMAAAVAAVAQLFAIDTSVANLPRQFLGITHDRATAQNLAMLGQVAAIIAVVVLAVVLLWRQRSRDGLGAHERSAVAAAGLIIAVLVGATAAWGLAGEHHDLSQSPWVSVAALAVPACLMTASVFETRFALDGVASIVADIGEQPSRSGLQASLAKALGDPSVQLAFWSNERNGYVSSTGRPVLVQASAAQAVSFVGEESDRLAAVLHDSALLGEPERVQAATGAIRIAIQNEQRNAVAASELRRSRARIAESAENARREVERNLHDGAQQRLLGVQLALTLEQQRAQAAGESVDPAFLEKLSTELGGAIEELRELGRGLRPSALDHGLGTAIESLAERSPLPVVTEFSADRVDTATEAAAFFVINECVANATRYSGADHVRVSVANGDGSLVVTIADDGRGGASVGTGSGSGLQSLEDRVLALDGAFSVTSPAGQGTVVMATFPTSIETEAVQ